MNDRFMCRIYGAMLYLYPADFRREYGQEMVQTFRDAYRDGSVHWLATIYDVSTTACAEHLVKMRDNMGWIKIAQSLVLFAAGIVGLLVSWLVLLIMVMAMTEIYLVPWDTAGNPPPLGTMARTVNDFFESEPGSLIPACLVILSSVGFFIAGLAQKRGSNIIRLAWLFGLSNMTGIGAMFVFSFGAVMLNRFLMPFPPGRGDPGFHRSILPAIICGVVMWVMLKIQKGFARSSDNSKPKGKLSMKRWFDIWAAILMLWLCSPVIAVMILLIKLDSQGSALFTQQRVGKGGRVFRLYKFRTMTTGENRQVTRIGRILRKISLDELPQLWNVLNGDMTIFGPRPGWIEAGASTGTLMETRPGLIWRY